MFSFGWALMVPVVTLMVLDLVPERRGMASSLQAVRRQRGQRRRRRRARAAGDALDGGAGAGLVRADDASASSPGPGCAARAWGCFTSGGPARAAMPPGAEPAAAADIADGALR
ncbi:MAG: hypothetical protein MZW92_62495 [Comamonadaceae bacterium]|nr:hypothetical protein [Comamonadaceae bacterium]